MPLQGEQGFGVSYRGAAFPDHSRFAAVAGGNWGEFGGVAEIRIISDGGGVLAKLTFDGEVVEGLGLSPDGRVLFVSLLSPSTGGGRGSEGRRCTVLLDLAPLDSSRFELVELRTIEGAAKAVRFSTDSRTVDIDGQLFSFGHMIADEPLPVQNPKEVKFTDDSSRMDILSSENKWKSFDTATGSEMQGSVDAKAPPGKSLAPEIKAAKSANGIEVIVDGQAKFKAGDPRIILGGASQDRDRLIWIRDDGAAQIVPLSAGALGGDWRAVRALYGHPWHEWTNDFLTVSDGGAARWTRIYRAENMDASAWKKSLGSIAPDAGDDAVATTIALHPGGRIAAIGATGSSRAGVSLIDVVTGKPLLDSVDVAAQDLTLFFSRDGSYLFVHGESSASAVGPLDVLDVTNGLPLKGAHFYAGPFVERPDGRRIVALGGNGDGPETLFDMLGDGTPVPLWIADLAEGVGGWRLGDHNTLRSLTPEEQTARIETARKELAALNGGSDGWAEFGRWYLSGDPDPAISPYSHMLRSQLAKKEADDWARTHAPASPDVTDDGRGGNPNIKLRDFLPPGTLVLERGATTPEQSVTSSTDAKGGIAPPDASVQPKQPLPTASAPVVTAKAEPEATDPAKGGYHVQIGAFLQKSEADKHITLVATRAADLVRDHAPIVIPPQGGSSRFYRARFTGFDEKQARETCRAMKLQKIDCIAAKGE